MRTSLAIMMCCCLSAGPLLADLASVRAVPNLEKRAAAALEHAAGALKDSRHAYSEGDLKRCETLLEEVAGAVELAENSLKETGKNPIKSPKHFKNAEIKTRGLLRTLDSFAHDVNNADRPMVERVKDKVQEAHDRLLQDIMTGKKK